MDMARLAEKLKELREAKFPSQAAFVRASKIEHAGVKQAESGDRALNIERLEIWVSTCGTTLSKFFEELERESRGSSSDIDVIAGYEEYYRNLSRIIESKIPLYIQGIHANLVAMAAQASQESGLETKPPPVRHRKQRRA